MPPEQWYDASHGYEYASRLAEHIRQKPDSVKDAEAVLYDLDAMAQVMSEGRQRDLKWHLLVDY